MNCSQYGYCCFIKYFPRHFIILYKYFISLSYSGYKNSDFCNWSLFNPVYITAPSCAGGVWFMQLITVQYSIWWLHAVEVWSLPNPVYHCSKLWSTDFCNWSLFNTVYNCSMMWRSLIQYITEPCCGGVIFAIDHCSIQHITAPSYEAVNFAIDHCAIQYITAPWCGGVIFANDHCSIQYITAPSCEAVIFAIDYCSIHSISLLHAVEEWFVQFQWIYIHSGIDLSMHQQWIIFYSTVYFSMQQCSFPWSNT